MRDDPEHARRFWENDHVEPARSLVLGTVAGLSGLAVGRAAAQIPGGFNPFVFSVASGDPTPDAVVIWTRLARAADDPTPVSDAPVAVEWAVATDQGMAQILRRGVAMAVPEFGHSVHVDVQGLDADRPYWYRFRVGGEAGRLAAPNTLPLPSAALSSFRFNVVTCQHWENGYFDAYDGMQDDDAAFVLHLGDYIYEVGRGGVRQHETKKP